MSLLHFFFSPYGRISRQAFWLGLIVLSAASLPISLLLDPNPLARTNTNEIAPPSLASTVWNLMLAWPSAAISIKRFNDRDRPWWIGYLMFVAMVAMLIANHAGLLLNPNSAAPTERLVFAGMLMFFVWALVDNALFRGTEGPNRYGPDPLEAAEGI
ncbi:MAG: DUF805 domain-containing protein [Hyphomicrobiaceae bacterium]